jgi:SNF2 family DNA or RNA helicase
MSILIGIVVMGIGKTIIILTLINHNNKEHSPKNSVQKNPANRINRYS